MFFAGGDKVIEKTIIVLMLILLGFVIHSIIPTYYNKYFNRNAQRKTSTKDEVMLTFDDGPDPRYTIRLLDLLAENDVKATFFMVAENAKKNKDIVRRMISEGHKVGLHSWQHRNAMLYSYAYTKKDFENSVKIMKAIGVDEIFYRPPWGHTNIFSNYFVNKFGLKMIFWDVMAEDWKSESVPEIIIDKLMKRVTPYSIICLHDAGENSGGDYGAPENTILALKVAIPRLKSKGYKFVLPE